MDNELFGKLLGAAKILIYEENSRHEQEKMVAEEKLLEERHAHLKAKAAKSATEGVGGNKALAIIMLALGVLTSIMLLVSPPEEGGAIAVFLVLTLPCFIVGIMLFKLAKDRLAKFEAMAVADAKELKRFETEELPALKAANKQKRIAIEENSREIALLKEDVLSFLPPMYWNSYAVAYMLLLVESGRADTLKEAMNMYEEERRYLIMLSAMDSMNRRLDCINRTIGLINANMAVMDRRIARLASVETVEYLTS